MSAEHWNERYLRGEQAHQAPLEFVERLLPLGDGRRALDLACGAGRHAVLMASRGWQVTAVDWSEAALAIVEARDRRIHTVRADLEAGEFSIEANGWDLIFVALYMQRSLFAPIRGGLRPGGMAAAAFPMVDEREGVSPMRREYLVAPGELRDLFAGFAIQHYAETEPLPPKRRMAEIWAQKDPDEC